MIEEFTVMIMKTHQIFLFMMDFLIFYLSYSPKQQLFKYFDLYQPEKEPKLSKKNILKIVKHLAIFFENHYNNNIFNFFQKFLSKDAVFEQILGNDKIFNFILEKGCNKENYLMFNSFLEHFQLKISIFGIALLFEKINKYLRWCEENDKIITYWKLKLFFQLLNNLVNYFKEKKLKIIEIDYVYLKEENEELMTFELFLQFFPQQVIIIIEKNF